MKKILIIALIFEITLCSNIDEKIICGSCHSHNDYLNDSPLFRAIEYGFASIEVDIVLHKQSLYVAHHWWLKKKDKVIGKIYLDNLYKIFNENDGYIQKNRGPLILLVDIKTAANETYLVLDKLLRKYRPMLTHMEGDSLIQGAVTIILSGNKPKSENLVDSKERYVFLDGRLSDIGKNISVNMMPLISIDWKDEFYWRGKNNISKEELNHLNGIISKVHLEGKKIRFWGSPDNDKSWKILYSAGVDLINTNKIIALSNFIANK